MCGPEAPARVEAVTERYEVIIVGSGAGGGTLAHALAPSGRRILLLERGDFLTRETDNWNPGPVFVDGKYISEETWYDADGQPFQPQVHYFIGGATKLYGAALYRLRPADFGEIKHADGVSPAWPLSYNDFEPWYTKAEWLYQVRGVLLDEADRPVSECVRCAWCDGYPCLVHAKADADIIAVRPLLARPNVHLLVNAQVERLETDPAGRVVTGVEVTRGGEREVYSGDIVVISAGAANSARILLRSASDRHPQGLANGSGQVGRNYMFHNSKAVLALGKEPNDTVFQKTLGLNDFYLAGNGRDWPLGNIQMLGKSNAMAFKGEGPKLTRLAPRWSLDEIARHGVDFWLTTEDVPQPGNRVTVDREGNVHLAYRPTNDEEATGLYPATSVLDVNCKAHELDNLYVVDTSFFPSIGAVNPALTAMANAIRVGEHLLSRMRG